MSLSSVPLSQMFLFISLTICYGCETYPLCQCYSFVSEGLSVIVKVLVILSCAQYFVTPCPVAHQAALSVKFSSQNYWSELPFPSPGDLPSPGIDLGSPTLQADSLPTEPPGKPPEVLRIMKELTVTSNYCWCSRWEVVSDFLWPNVLQDASVPCPSLSPGVCSNSYPLSTVMPYNDLILCSPLLLLPSSFPASGFFPVS